jgi:hypothetical protein
VLLNLGAMEIDSLLRKVESRKCRLVYLRIVSCCITKEVMEGLILHFSSLTHLDLYASTLPKEGFEILGRALQGDSQIKKLDFTAIRMEERGGIEKGLWGLIKDIKESANQTLCWINTGQVEEKMEKSIKELFLEEALEARKCKSKVVLL